MHEMVIPLRWNYIDRLLAFLDDILCGYDLLTERRAQIAVLVEEAFSIAMASGGAGDFGCRVQEPNRMVLRFDGGEAPVDLAYLVFLGRRIAPEDLQVTPGVNSCLIQWR